VPPTRAASQLPAACAGAHVPLSLRAATSAATTDNYKARAAEICCRCVQLLQDSAQRRTHPRAAMRAAKMPGRTPGRTEGFTNAAPAWIYNGHARWCSNQQA
jgi:hypothetical protein